MMCISDHTREFGLVFSIDCGTLEVLWHDHDRDVYALLSHYQMC